MAQLGRQSTQFVILGTKRNDPLPRILRKYSTLKSRKDKLYKILRSSAQPMAEQMRRTAPVGRTGALSNSFRVRKAKKKIKFTETAVFVGGVNGNYSKDGGPGKMVGWRAHWAELGTVNHSGAYFIQPAIRTQMPVVKALIRKKLATLLRNLRSGKSKF